MQASTGAAAVLCRGTTLHSFAGVGLGKGSARELASKINKTSAKRWRQCEVLVIDEISMVDGEYLDKVDHGVRWPRWIRFLAKDPESNKTQAKVTRGRFEPFGGVQLVACGDFLQLPPVRVTSRVPA